MYDENCNYSSKKETKESLYEKIKPYLELVLEIYIIYMRHNQTTAFVQSTSTHISRDSSYSFGLHCSAITNGWSGSITIPFCEATTVLSTVVDFVITRKFLCRPVIYNSTPICTLVNAEVAHFLSVCNCLH